jgi:Rieske Fe-S protein
METNMFNLRTRVAMLAVTAAVALTSFTPSFAVQMPAAPTPAAAIAVPATSADVQQVQWRHGPGPGPYWRHGGYRGGYYNGYRGYGGYRDGYRRYNDGYWYPLAAFGAGAIIGGAIASEPRYVEQEPSNGINPRHYEWCANRYRSYRGFDNTFQPNNGPRQQCLSPFY